MKGSLKVRFAVVAVALAVGGAGFAAQPASASTGTAAITGTGGFAVGLGVTGPAQAFNFTGDGAVATTTVQGTLVCAIAGYDNIGSVLQGQGNFNGNCNTGAGPVGVAGNFTRAGTFVTVNGAANGAVTGAFTGSCVFSPLPGVTTNPIVVSVNGFAVSCLFAIT
jgi:hypothetical protein